MAYAQDGPAREQQEPLKPSLTLSPNLLQGSVDRVDVNVLRVEPPAHPCPYLAMLWMARIPQRRQQLGILTGPSTIFRRAMPGSIQTHGTAATGIGR